MLLVIINFISQRVFVNTLGIEYLGLNSLFNNLISMLSIAELGLGVAITYHLYAPLSKRDMAAVSSIIQFYKKTYRIIAFIIVSLGAIALPFLPLVVGQNHLTVNIQVAYMLFVANAAVSYLLSYKRSILYADQKNYLIDIAHTGTSLTVQATQIGILLLTHNYYLYLIIRLIATIVENLIINAMVDKRYHLEKYAKAIDKQLRLDIITKVKGLLFHKVGQFAVLGTDSLIISFFFGVKTLGLYSNYLLILTVLDILFTQLSNALTASVGNLLLDENSEKHMEVFNRLYLAILWISTLAAVGFFVSVNPFITLWLGHQYLFSPLVVAAISTSLFLTMVRMPMNMFKTAAGIFHEDRFMAVIEAAINLALSLILLHLFGLIGVFLGTIISTLFLHVYSYPKYTYSVIFQKAWKGYWSLIAQSCGIAISIATIAHYLSSYGPSEQKWGQLGWSVVVGLALPNIVLFIIYRKTAEYAYFRNLIKDVIGRIIGYAKITKA